MNKTKMMLCFLLALVLIIPLAISVAPAVQADPDESQGQAVQADLEGPQEGAQTTLYANFYPPLFFVWYYCKGKCTLYDWWGSKATYTDGWLVFACQDTYLGHTVTAACVSPAYPAPGQTQIGIVPEGMTLPLLPPKEPGQAPAVRVPPPDKNLTLQPLGGPSASWCAFPNGWVGPTYISVDPVKLKVKLKNKPKLSLFYWTGTYNNSYTPPTSFTGNVLNAQVKKVITDVSSPYFWYATSIKGTLEGWGQGGAQLFDGSPTYGQYEFKFTATPYD